MATHAARTVHPPCAPGELALTTMHADARIRYSHRSRRQYHARAQAHARRGRRTHTSHTHLHDAGAVAERELVGRLAHPWPVPPVPPTPPPPVSAAESKTRDVIRRPQAHVPMEQSHSEAPTRAVADSTATATAATHTTHRSAARRRAPVGK